MIALEDVRVGIPHDRIHGVRGVVRDPEGLQGDRVAVRVDPIRQKLPGFRTRGGGIRIKGLNAIVGWPPPPVLSASGRWNLRRARSKRRERKQR